MTNTTPRGSDTISADDGKVVIEVLTWNKMPKMCITKDGQYPNSKLQFLNQKKHTTSQTWKWPQVVSTFRGVIQRFNSLSANVQEPLVKETCIMIHVKKNLFWYCEMAKPKFKPKRIWICLAFQMHVLNAFWVWLKMLLIRLLLLLSVD